MGEKCLYGDWHTGGESTFELLQCLTALRNPHSVQSARYCSMLPATLLGPGGTAVSVSVVSTAGVHAAASILQSSLDSRKRWTRRDSHCQYD